MGNSQSAHARARKCPPDRPCYLAVVDKAEAREILEAETWALGQLTYEQLRSTYKSPQAFVRRGSSGVTYQLEVQSFLDDTDTQNLRVLISIDDGGLRAFKPMTTDFIVAPGDAHAGGQASGV